MPPFNQQNTGKKLTEASLLADPFTVDADSVRISLRGVVRLLALQECGQWHNELRCFRAKHLSDYTNSGSPIQEARREGHALYASSDNLVI